MPQLRLNLPETLHQHLAYLAEVEGIPLNQYIVYVLAQRMEPAYEIRQIPEEEISQQEQSFYELRQRLSSFPSNEVDLILAQREQVEPEADLKPEAVEWLQQRIRERSNPEF